MTADDVVTFGAGYHGACSCAPNRYQAVPSQRAKLGLVSDSPVQLCGAESIGKALQPTRRSPAQNEGYDLINAKRSALIVSAWVVGIPCGNPL